LDAEILYANKALLDIYGYSSIDELKSIPAVQRYLPDSYEELQERIILRKEGKFIAPHFNVSIKRKDGVIRQLDVYNFEIDWSGERRFQVIYRDITERVQMEAALKIAQRNFRNTLDNSPMGIIIVDMNDQINYANKTYLRMYGYDSLDELKSTPRKKRFTRESYLKHQNMWEKVRQGKDIPSSYEISIIDKKGKIKHLEAHRKGVNWDGNRQNQLLFHDITERKEASQKIDRYQKSLRSLVSQLSLAEERERRRIAIGLHDYISQTLVACRMKLQFSKELLDSPELTQNINEIESLISHTIDQTRTLTFELSSPLLYEIGLEAAVERHIEELGKREGIQIEFRDDQQPKSLSTEINILMFHIIRELLLNIVKHAKASKALVQLNRIDGNLRIVVEDNGIGFNVPESMSQSKRIQGFGIFSIRERLNHIGGNIEIKSKINSGTQVTINVPLIVDKK
jgi:PAS domain S-box-containing protein